MLAYLKLKSKKSEKGKGNLDDLPFDVALAMAD